MNVPKPLVQRLLSEQHCYYASPDNAAKVACAWCELDMLYRQAHAEATRFDQLDDGDVFMLCGERGHWTKLNDSWALGATGLHRSVSASQKIKVVIT